MRKSTVLCAACAAIVVIVFGAKANAAQPSAERMNQMGMSGAQIVTDSVAMNVRGHGYSGGNRSRIWGSAKVSINGFRRTDRYNSTATGSQSDSTFVAVPIGGVVLFGGGGSAVRVGGH